MLLFIVHSLLLQRLGCCLLFAAILCHSTTHSLRVVVFGGSGFVGRRVCQELVHAGVDVVSVSRSGTLPPSFDSYEWKNAVEWIQADIVADIPPLIHLGENVDAVVSCIGNVKPAKEWKQLFGLGFDDDTLRDENGGVNEQICRLAKLAGAKRFIFISVSYQVAKALEGPLQGYIQGKRQAEQAALTLFGQDNTIVIGPSLIYGGARYPKLGQLYKTLVESAPAKAYLATNSFLRHLSSTPQEDWLEAMIFSSPVHVSNVSKVVCAGVMGLLTREIVGDRQQGFFDTLGQPVDYANVLFVDGTRAIERLSSQIAESPKMNSLLLPTSNRITIRIIEEPPMKGALVGMGPYLRPIPVVVMFATIFWSVMTQQFIQVVS
jgi:nucleoside-diphosphate-sugar epimerase